MDSAFGVDHGVSKAFTKLDPKLRQARLVKVPHDTLPQKLRAHATGARQSSGMTSASAKMWGGLPNAQQLAQAKTEKTAAHGMYTAVSRLNRAKRVLP